MRASPNVIPQPGEPERSRVAGFFALDGSLTINQDTPSVGREAVTAAIQSFMSAFPNLVMKMDNLTVEGPHVKYHWTLIGTNTGPGATGKSVCISGYEQWRFTDDGLIAESQAHFRSNRLSKAAGRYPQYAPFGSFRLMRPEKHTLGGENQDEEISFGNRSRISICNRCGIVRASPRLA
jgi:SnoaL-like polyketide cyclase